MAGWLLVWLWPHDGLAVLMNALAFSSRIGRVAGRLPQELADDVVGSVLDCFRYVQGGGGRGAEGALLAGGGGFSLRPFTFSLIELLVRAPELRVFLCLK